MMNHPLTIFCQELLSSKSRVDPAEIEIVQDNCAKLSEEARSLVRLSYRSSVSLKSSSRWDSCEVFFTSSPTGASQRRSRAAALHENFQAEPKVFPIRRGGLGSGEDCLKPGSISSTSQMPFTSSRSRKTQLIDTIPNLPPRCPTQRSSLRWSLALDACVRELDYFDDGESDSDSDSETTYTASDLDLGDWFSDADSDDESDNDDYNEDNDDKSESGDDLYISASDLRPHEWTFPPNMILPNIQAIIHEAAHNKNVDINQRIKSLSLLRTDSCPTVSL